MTALPETTAKKLGLVIDLDTCVGCQACATSCKEWNTGGYSAPLTDQNPYGADPHGAWLNRVHGFEMGEGEASQTVHFPRSCLHCEAPACVLPEFGYKPVNKYLPPRRRRDARAEAWPTTQGAGGTAGAAPGAAADRLFAWIDRVLSG